MSVEASRTTEPEVLAPDRLRAVHRTGLLDSPAQDSWDGLTVLASRLLRAPMAFMTLVDETRSFWLSCVGVPASGVRQNDVQESFCQYVIADRAPFVVGDTTADPRTAGNPSVQLLGVRAWAGYPVLDAQGQPLGSFCVMDTVTRTWTEEDVEVLGVLAAAASAQIQILGAVAAERLARVDLERVRAGEQRAEDRLQRLASVALELVAAETVDDLVDVIVHRAVPVLGADGGAVLVRDEDGTMRLAISERLGQQTRVDYGVLPADDPLPACHVARTGERLVLPTLAACVAFTPEMEQVCATTQRKAWAFMPLRVSGRVLGSLAVSWVEEQVLTGDELDLLDAFAAQCAQALDRIRVSEAQREAMLAVQHLAEALQRGLLTQPAPPADLDIAVRYLPAVSAAQVGGDWYDAFNITSGATLLSVGDVAGHDRNAAASMGQLRNLLRGLAVDSDDSPAVLLTRLDRAIATLGLDALATALVARVEHPAGGVRRVRWSSAGHPPALLRLRDGRVQALSAPADLLLGVDPTTPRADHVIELPDGAGLVLYTDGLVERRGEVLDDGITRLRLALAATGDLAADPTCDAVLQRMLPQAPDDDVALLVVRPRRS